MPVQVPVGLSVPRSGSALRDSEDLATVAGLVEAFAVAGAELLAIQPDCSRATASVTRCAPRWLGVLRLTALRPAEVGGEASFRVTVTAEDGSELTRVATAEVVR